jgi:hypothetical protein
MGLIEFEVIPVRVDKVEHGQCPFPRRPKVDLGASYLHVQKRAVDVLSTGSTSTNTNCGDPLV